MQKLTLRRGSQLVFLALTLFLSLRLHQEFGRAPSYGIEASYDAEERVNVWLLSAQCFQRSGVPLMICRSDGGLVPIENAYVADDRGHALLANLAALRSSLPVTRVTLVKINLCINALGIFLLALFWHSAGLRWTALLTVALGCRYGLPGPLAGHDAPASYFGVFCLAALPTIWLATLDVRSYSKGKLWMGSALSFLGLAEACLLRQPIGLLGAVAVSMLLISTYLRERGWQSGWRSESFKKLCLGGFLIWMALCVPPALLQWRNFLYRIPEAQSYHSHGIWHALYLGLGWVPNPWGIVWDDRFGVQAAGKINSNAAYGTYEYFNVMRGLYLHLWLHEPWAILKVYALKSFEVWKFPLFVLGIRISAWFLAITAAALYLIKKAKGPERYPLKMILSMALLYVLFSLQGVVAIPTGTHLYPLKFCALLMMALWADYVWVLEPVTRWRDAQLSGDGKRRGRRNVEGENVRASGDR